MTVIKAMFAEKQVVTLPCDAIQMKDTMMLMQKKIGSQNG